MATEKVGIGTVTRDHAQFAVRENAVEQWGGLRASG